ncbi:MAG: chromosomal replication initiator DnaA [Pseudorhodobacter sp.]
MNRQLTLDLPPRHALGREDFFVSKANAAALAGLDGWREWPGGRMLLIGPEGAGKTHLSHVWAANTGAMILSASELPRMALPQIAGAGVAVVEDAETIAGNAEAETALFHLHNLMGENRAALLITAARPVPEWELTLPDLQSRIQAMAQLSLAPPDDALLMAVLVKLFADRQITVNPALIPYLTSRMERSFAAARDIVEKLDREALSTGGGVSLPLAKRVLGRE